MLRYTQDDWVVNGAPNAGEANGLWGDDPYPAVDTNWDQPGHSLVAQLSQTIGDDSVNTVTFSYSGNEISLSRGPATNPGLNSQINAAIPAAFGGKTGGAERSHPVFWGAAGYGALWNIAPWENKQDLMVLKDDYSQVFGKHWLKVGALYSENKKKEYIGGSSAAETPQFWGPSTGHNGWGAHHRQPPVRLPAPGHDVRLCGKLAPAGSGAELGGRRVLRRRHLAGQPPPQRGLRGPLLELQVALRQRRPAHDVRTGPVRSGPGRRPVQRPGPGAGNRPPAATRVFWAALPVRAAGWWTATRTTSRRASAWPTTSSATAGA